MERGCMVAVGVVGGVIARRVVDSARVCKRQDDAPEDFQDCLQRRQIQDSVLLAEKHSPKKSHCQVKNRPFQLSPQTLQQILINPTPQKKAQAALYAPDAHTFMLKPS